MTDPVQLATVEDYELLIGPVPDADVPRLEAYLPVASGIVYTIAPRLLLVDMPPIPPAATLVTCQVASGMLAEPTGASGAVSSERIGQYQASYNVPDNNYGGLLPAGWELLLKPWLPLQIISYPMESKFYPDDRYYWGYWNWQIVADGEEEVEPHGTVR